MAGTGRRKRGAMITEINVTPLVDIMLVLLIIYMLTANVVARHRAIEVDLPGASQATELAAGNLAVVLSADGTMSLEGVPIDRSQLERAVTAALAKNPKAQAVIAADKMTTHGHVVWVIDVIKSRGMSAFAIEIDPSKMQAPGSMPSPGTAPSRP